MKSLASNIALGLVLTCALAATTLASPPAQPATKPNIIVIFTDDQGFADLGCQGVRSDVKTPHLDALAAGGIRFARGYVTAPQCVPSRAGLITGRYQTRFGVDENTKGPLPASEKTLADRLKNAGYVTGMIGKWHLDHSERPAARATTLPAQPRNRTEPRRTRTVPGRSVQNRGLAVRHYPEHLPGRHGFTEYFCGTMRRYVASFDLEGNTLGNAPQSVVDDRYRIDVQTDAAIAFLKRRVATPERPFFLYLAYFAPHVPLEKPPKYMERFAGVTDETRRMGLAAMSAVDDGVGRIREFLREHKLEENTLVWFISDNGAPLRPGAWNGSLNEPLVGEKGMLTDGGIRVPFLASWKGVLPAGTTYDHAVISLDVAATAVALAGLPSDPSLDGVNLLPFLTGKNADAPHEFLFWRWRTQAAVLWKNWKLVTLSPGEWKLFNVEKMDGEQANVAAEHPDIVKRLEECLRGWAAEQKTPGLLSEGAGQAEGKAASSRPLPTIAWDDATLRLIERGGDYARMARLGDGSIACVYDRDRKMWIRHSTDEGMTWKDPILVAEDPECWLTNADLLPLKDGTLLYFWNERPLAAVRNQHKEAPPGLLTRPFLIRTARSTDLGRTWSKPETLYTAGPTFQDGCWEPAGLQLPSGEVQVYFSNEAPFQTSAEQEIALLRSQDGGKTWSKAERISLRKGYRDGMPAPLLLAGGRGMIVAIEDNGHAGERFKPVIFHTSMADNWRSGVVDGENLRRKGALAEPLDPAWYGGAPCLRQLPSGHTLLSYQEGSSGTMEHCRMAVCIGDPTGRNFTNKTYPLPAPTRGYQAWNSLFVKNANTVTAISSATVNGVRGIWAIDGRVKTKGRAPQ